MVRSAKKVKEFQDKKLLSVLARKKMSYSYPESYGDESLQSTPQNKMSFSDNSFHSSTPVCTPKDRHKDTKRIDKSVAKDRNITKERRLKNSSLNISKRRRRSGAVALREIRNLQKTTNLLIPKLPFMRIVQEILQSYSTEPYRIQSQALEALQEMTEIVMVDLFSEALLCCSHAKRVTIMVDDMRLTRRIKGRDDVIN